MLLTKKSEYALLSLVSIAKSNDQEMSKHYLLNLAFQNLF